MISKAIDGTRNPEYYSIDYRIENLYIDFGDHFGVLKVIENTCKTHLRKLLFNFMRINKHQLLTSSTKFNPRKTKEIHGFQKTETKTKNKQNLSNRFTALSVS